MIKETACGDAVSMGFWTDCVSLNDCSLIIYLI